MCFLGIVAHQRAIGRQYRIGVFGTRRKQHNGNRIICKAERAVIQIQNRILCEPPVFMGNIKAPFPQLEVFFGFGLLHGADQAVVLLSSVIQMPKACDHLAWREKVVLVVFVIHIFRIFTHNRRNQNAVPVVIG